MRYMCLVHFEASKLTSASLAERQDIDRRSLAYDEELRQGGHYLASQAIQGPESAVLVRVRNGSMSTTDGPYVETKEQVGGFYLVEARDLDEAIMLAQKMPVPAAVEVRPVMYRPGA